MGFSKSRNYISIPQMINLLDIEAEIFFIALRLDKGRKKCMIEISCPIRVIWIRVLRRWCWLSI